MDHWRLRPLLNLVELHRIKPGDPRSQRFLHDETRRTSHCTMQFWSSIIYNLFIFSFVHQSTSCLTTILRITTCWHISAHMLSIFLVISHGFFHMASWASCVWGRGIETPGHSSICSAGRVQCCAKCIEAKKVGWRSPSGCCVEIHLLLYGFPCQFLPVPGTDLL